LQSAFFLTRVKNLAILEKQTARKLPPPTKPGGRFQAGLQLSQINQYDFYQGYDGNMIVLQCSAPGAFVQPVGFFQPTKSFEELQ